MAQACTLHLSLHTCWFLLGTKTHQGEESSSKHTDLKLRSHHYLLILKLGTTLKVSKSTSPLFPHLKNELINLSPDTCTTVPQGPGAKKMIIVTSMVVRLNDSFKACKSRSRSHLKRIQVLFIRETFWWQINYSTPDERN